MKSILALFTVMLLAAPALRAQQAESKALKEQFTELEKRFSEAVMSRDPARAKAMQTDTYFLSVGVKGKPLLIVPQEDWLKNLKNYVVESYAIDDLHVHVYGKVAVVSMLYTQQAKVAQKDRSAQIYLTDIWVQDDTGWRITERHSSRPE